MKTQHDLGPRDRLEVCGPGGQVIELSWRPDLEGFQVRANYEKGGDIASAMRIRPDVANTIIVIPGDEQ